MSDDTRRPGDDDEKPTDPPTGEGEVVGADWLLSQLGREQTGEIEIPRPSEKPDAAAPENGQPPAKPDNPVLAWWREKLVAADQLVNPEPRPDAEEDTVLPEPGWTARSGAESTGPALFEPRRRTPAPEPEPEPQPDVSAGPEDEDDGGWSLSAEAGPADEPETGLIPSADPPLFKPRSAREHIVEEADDSTPVSPVESPRPAVIEPAATLPTAAPVPPAMAPDQDAARSENARPDADTDAATGTDSDADADTDTDLGPFSWSLSPNDELDPLVHRGPGGKPGPARKRTEDRAAEPVDESGDQQTAVFPAVGVAASASDAPASHAPAAPGHAEHPPRRRRRQTEQPAAPEPVVIAPLQESAPAPAGPPRPTRDGSGGRPPRALLWGAVALVAVLLIGGLFFLGSRLPALLAGPAPAPTASETPTPSATPTPTPTTAPAGPAAVGEQKWTALTGGECLDPYSTPWAETFTVVDCAAPHAAQMVFSAPVSTDAAAPYPGEDVILKQISLWCSAPGVLDAAAAGAYSDLQVQGTYPVSEEQWDAGERNYFCFVNRSGTEPLTGSVAAPRG